MSHPQQATQFSTRTGTRRSRRLLRRKAVLACGQAADGSVFAEDTCTLNVSAGGALILLDAGVLPGQTIMLRNRANDEEIACRVVRLGKKHGDKTEVGVGFAHSAPQFWQIGFSPAGKPFPS